MLSNNLKSNNYYVFFLLLEFPFPYLLCCFKIQMWNRVRNQIGEANSRLHVCIRTSIFLAVQLICTEKIATVLVKLCSFFEQPFSPVMTSSSRPQSVLTTCSQLQCMHFSTQWCNAQRCFWIKPSSQQCGATISSVPEVESVSKVDYIGGKIVKRTKKGIIKAINKSNVLWPLTAMSH